MENHVIKRKCMLRKTCVKMVIFKNTVPFGSIGKNKVSKMYFEPDMCQERNLELSWITLWFASRQRSEVDATVFGVRL